MTKKEPALQITGKVAVTPTFLTFTSEFEVLLANYYLSHYHQEHLEAVFPNFPTLDRRQLLDAPKALANEQLS